MVSFKTLSTANSSTNGTGKLAVVTGGTQGIGAGIALRFALSGANVWVAGRSKEKGEQVVEQLRVAGAEGRRRFAVSGDGDYAFLQADLVSVEGIKSLASDIEKRAGKEGVDFLVETQGGPPNGKLKQPATPSSPEGGFAVQCLSRFGLAYLLAQSGTLKPTAGVCWVASPAQGGSKPLDVDDLDFLKAHKDGKFSEGYLSIPKMGMRDSSVLDSVGQTLAERNPRMTITHLFPGIVGTDAVSNAGFPFPLPQASKLAGWLGLISMPKPGSYPEVPFYLLATQEAKSHIRLGEVNLFGPSLKRYDITTNVEDESVRSKVWDRMTAYFQ